LQSKYAPYLFVAPFVVLFCCFMVYPLVRSVTLSFYQTAGPRTARWVGLANYRFLLTDRLFWQAVWNTVYYAAVFISVQVPLSLGLALLLNTPGMRFRNFFRFAFFSSHLVGGVFVAVIFTLLLADRHGMINKAIGAALPWVGTELKWLSKPAMVMPAIILGSLWLSVGYGMIYFLAALQAVDRDLYEAAAVDGAGKVSQFFNVTLPGIRPILLFMVLVGTIGSLQLFELPYVLLNGGAGPNNAGLTIVMYLFQTGFITGDIGYASAIGWVLVLMILGVSLLQLKFSRQGGDE
jgi:ABC-type sugar transport system permease subunit